MADGLDNPLNWESAGYDMPPLEWHQKLKEARNARLSDGESKKDAPLIFDCRNSYETSVGIFEGAQPLGTENFSDSWDVFKERLKDQPKDAPIMTYCTGGKYSMLPFYISSLYLYLSPLAYYTLILSTVRDSMCKSWSVFNSRIRIHQCVKISWWYHCI